MALKLSPYSLLLERRLFSSTPQVAQVEVPKEYLESDTIEAQLELIKYYILEALKPSERAKDCLILGADLVKKVLLSTKLDTEDFGLIYKLWELRFSLLVLSMDTYCLNLAKQEAKKLSSHLFKLTQALHGDNRKIGFPSNFPLSLELLMIRLRTNSPSSLCNTELYTLLWIIREGMHKSISAKELVSSTSIIVYLLSFNVSANLIAKRDYLSFLTHCDSILHGLASTQYTKVDELIYGHYGLLGALTSLLKGDYYKSEQYYKKYDTSAHKEVCKATLKKVLTTITPILDTDNLLNLEPITEPPNIDSWQDLLELNKHTRITGRILCCYCASVELSIRGDEFVDVYRSGKQRHDNLVERDDTEAIDLLVDLWKRNVNKLYCFE